MVFFIVITMLVCHLYALWIAAHSPFWFSVTIPMEQNVSQWRQRLNVFVPRKVVFNVKYLFIGMEC